ncbi:MAG: ABC transporter ATP-binding protein [Aggregatilineales bacterium]
MSSKTAIAVNNVSKWYGDFKAVDAVSFEVYGGEIFALLGPNGAGKSTTIRMILDIIKPDSGTIAILGSPLNDGIKDRIGYLPEERGLYKTVKVIEMMRYLGQLKGLSGRDAESKAKVLLEKLDLLGHADNKVEELSKGMQQKVQFAVTVMHEPDLIIIDEPFSGLDPVNRLVIKDLLLEFRDRGGAIVMSTHQMNQVEEMADRMIMISRGQQKLYGAVEDIRRDYAQHAIIVEGQGAWDTLDGVSRVEYGETDRDGVTLHLHENVTSDDVLASIARAQTMNIARFELAIPSLDDIFIRVAGEQETVR